MKIKNKTCAVCGKKITGSGRKYCSKACFCRRGKAVSEKSISEVARINSLAAEKNLSYGKYVAAYEKERIS